MRWRYGWVIDQKRKVKMTGYWPSWTRSVKNGFIFSYCFMENCSCGTQWVLPNEKDSAILTARIANHSAVFGTYLYSNCYPALISVNLQCLCSVVYFHNVILQTCFVESRNLPRNWKKVLSLTIVSPMLFCESERLMIYITSRLLGISQHAPWVYYAAKRIQNAV